MYDIIGDIHGFAEPLKRLLHELGYKPSDSGWAHSDRQAIFVGDFIDRGPAQVESVQIAREMVECGQAIAVMGNHEFNAVSFSTPHPSNALQRLRENTSSRRRDHQSFLDQIQEGSALHEDVLAWFQTLPLFVELDGLRIVHASWCPRSITDLSDHLTADNSLKPSAWLDANTKGTPIYEAVERLIKGYEISLPKGIEFKDKEGNLRREARLRWWEDRDLLLRDAIMVPNAEQMDLPDSVVSRSEFLGYDNLKPVFFGHYWWTGKIEPLTESVACVDYSIANIKTPGRLVAYRWNGESTLDKSQFLSVGV